MEWGLNGPGVICMTIELYSGVKVIQHKSFEVVKGHQNDCREWEPAAGGTIYVTQPTEWVGCHLPGFKGSNIGMCLEMSDLLHVGSTGISED